MLNPVLSNFQIMIGDDFFSEDITTKYDNFLFKRNYPLKSFYAYFHETIKTITIPGFEMPTLEIDALNNMKLSAPGSDNFIHPVSKYTVAGHEPYENMLTSKTFIITFKNTVLNYMFVFEWMYDFYKRKRDKNVFPIVMTFMDSSDTPMMRYTFAKSFPISLPNLEYSFNNIFDESKEFDVGFQYNNFNVDFVIPDFNSTTFSF